MAKLPVEKLKASKSSKAQKAVPVKIVSEPAPANKVDGDRERKWKAEDALRTVKEYERVRSDKSLMKDVKKLAQDEMRKLKQIC